MSKSPGRRVSATPEPTAPQNANGNRKYPLRGTNRGGETLPGIRGQTSTLFFTHTGTFRTIATQIKPAVANRLTPTFQPA